MTRLPILAFIVAALFQVACLEATPQASADFEQIVLKTGKQPGPAGSRPRKVRRFPPDLSRTISLSQT